MNTILFLLEKEFRQIFRNKTVLAIIMVIPVVQLLILPLAANYEIRNINLAVVDHDRSDYSRELITKIAASGYFRLNRYSNSYDIAMRSISSDDADLILEIPAAFERNLIREGMDNLFIGANAINGVKAGLGSAYLNQIIRDFNEGIIVDAYPSASTQRLPSRPSIDVIASNWYNPHLNYQNFMVPGILAILMTMIGGYLSALNIVKEKESGTIEQINVTPIRKYQFIIGKLIPFWVIGMVVFTIGLIVSWLVYGIVPEGDLHVLYIFLALYLLAVLGIGLLISTFAETQQQAMFIAFFFVMIFILMSGLFTPINSMPPWAQVVSSLNPVTYFIEVMRMVVLKGSGLHDIRLHILATLIFGIFFNTWAIMNYKKTS